MASTMFLSSPFCHRSSESRVGLRSSRHAFLECKNRTHSLFLHPTCNLKNKKKKVVSCSSLDEEKEKERKKDDELRMDRRDLMMMGTATLSLFTPALASATPVSVPDLTTCKLAEIPPPPGPVVKPSAKVNCCLVNPTKPVVAYKFPKSNPMRVRMPAHKVKEAYIAKYNQAYALMKALPVNDPRNFMRQADLHCAYCNHSYSQSRTNTNLQIHFSALFFPWHRWYLYFHERILAKLINDPSFALPFWAWDDQETGGNAMPKMYMRDNTAIYDCKRHPEHLPPKLNTLHLGSKSVSNDEIVLENLSEMYRSVVTASNANLFLGTVVRAGQEVTDKSGLGGSMENGPHTAIHAWTGDSINQTYGEDMGNFYSAARDPIFYAHHSNVDRMWDVWKTLGKSRHDHTDSDFLNTEFYFYNEEVQMVKVNVRDCLNSARMGFTYEKMPSDQKWIHFEPKPLAKTRSAAPVDANTVLEIGAATAGKESRPIGTKLLSSAQRTPKGRRKKEEEELEEVLVLEGVEVPRNVVTQLLVFINLPSADETTPTYIPEYAGSFYSIPHAVKNGVSNVRTTDVRLAISDNIKRLGITDLSKIVVTVVARGSEVEGTPIKIKGIRIDLE